MFKRVARFGVVPIRPAGLSQSAGAFLQKTSHHVIFITGISARVS
jgi:hypothetical protein